MLKAIHSFTSYSVDDADLARDFYAKILGLEQKDNSMGLQFVLPGGGSVFLYTKPDHVPATYTVLNFEVHDIDEAVDELTALGVKFELYDEMNQDEKGIARGRAIERGPDIAWFKDPAGNVLSVLK